MTWLVVPVLLCVIGGVVAFLPADSLDVEVEAAPRSFPRLVAITALTLVALLGLAMW